MLLGELLEAPELPGLELQGEVDALRGSRGFRAGREPRFGDSPPAPGQALLCPALNPSSVCVFP